MSKQISDLEKSFEAEFVKGGMANEKFEVQAAWNWFEKNHNEQLVIKLNKQIEVVEAMRNVAESNQKVAAYDAVIRHLKATIFFLKRNEEEQSN